MEPSDLLRFTVGVLEGLKVRYFVTGSVATVFFGDPRYTNDIDIVVALLPGKIAEFCRAFPEPDFYVSEDAVRQAVAICGQFNIIHPTSGLKIDVMLPEMSAFNTERFGRVVRIRPEADYEASFASPEDVVIKKMQFYREGGSEKHLRDITGVLKISGDRIDMDYIEEWSKRLGLAEVWDTIKSSSNE